jgi:hypothetical protein
VGAHRKHLKRAAFGLVLVALALGLTAGAGSAAAPRAAATAETMTCKLPSHSFVPGQATIPALRRQVRVIQVERTSDNQMGKGPVTEEGKWLMAMDPHNRPGSRRGSVLLSGHTWPDGSALGNAMLASVGSGDRIVLTGKAGEKICYGIYERKSYPADEVPSNQVFRNSGPEQMVFVACSGKRTSPGHWTRRTLWFAKPVVTKPASSPTPSQPPPDDDSSSLLGGLFGGLFGG